ncbi:MAG: substrate-binding domain-containing protein [Clostridia bacterium]|nr:substrate-binding domain-containing protein [Clostridia bacterium]
MKKVMSVLMPIIIMIIVAGACVGLYYFFTHNNGKTESETSVKTSEEISNEPLFKFNEYPKVDASLATQPLTNAFIKNFVGENVDLNQVEYTNTHPGYVKLINGEADLIVVTEPSEEEKKLAEEAGVELEVIPVVKEGFVFYVNGDNPVDSISLENIQKIYTGEIKNWKELGGEDAEIKAFQRPVNSGSQTGMLSLVMKGLKLMDAPKENLVDTMEQIINLVSSYDNGRNSIGYSYYYYATTMYEDIDKDVANGIKLVKVNGIEPNYDTIKNGEYPIETAYYIVVRKNDQSENTKKLVDAMLSHRGQNVAKEAGYVPVE